MAKNIYFKNGKFFKNDHEIVFPSIGMFAIELELYLRTGGNARYAEYTYLFDAMQRFFTNTQTPQDVIDFQDVFDKLQDYYTYILSTDDIYSEMQTRFSALEQPTLFGVKGLAGNNTYLFDDKELPFASKIFDVGSNGSIEDDGSGLNTLRVRIPETGLYTIDLNYYYIVSGSFTSGLMEIKTKVNGSVGDIFGYKQITNDELSVGIACIMLTNSYVFSKDDVVSLYCNLTNPGYTRTINPATVTFTRNYIIP